MDKLLNEQFYGIEKTPNNNNYKQFDVKKNKWHWAQVSVACVIKVVISIIALILAWECSANSNIALRILYSIIAATFAEFYIIYYAIYRVFLDNKCN